MIRNACTKGYLLVSGGTKSIGISPLIVAVQPVLPMHSGATGFKVIVDFEWGPLVVAGDEITTTVGVKDISERDGRGYYVFESTSANQRREQVCRGTWTQIVRGV